MRYLNYMIWLIVFMVIVPFTVSASERIDIDESISESLIEEEFVNELSDLVVESIPRGMIDEQSGEILDASTQVITAQGKCGDSCKWKITDHTLYVYGSGTAVWSASLQEARKTYSTSITTIVVESGVSQLDFNLFCDWKKVTDVSLPDSLKKISTNAFASCSSLAEISIPSGEIEDCAFQYCTSLKKVVLGDCVSYIDGSAFDGCRSLNAFSVSSDNSVYSTKSGILFSKTKKKLVCYPPNKQGEQYTIPSTVTTIGNSAFLNNKNLVQLVIPESVVVIQHRAFSRMQSCSSMTIPSSVTTIESSLFYESELQKLTIKAKMDSLPPYSLWGCKRLTMVQIPDTVKTIGYGAFYDCANLTDIDWPQGLTVIEEEAFVGSSIVDRPDNFVGDDESGWKRQYIINVNGTYNQSKARSLLESLNQYRTSGNAWYYDKDDNVVNLGKLSALKYDYQLEALAMKRATELHLLYSHEGLSGEKISTKQELILRGEDEPDAVYRSWLAKFKMYSGQRARRTMLRDDIKAVGIASFTINNETYWVMEVGETVSNSPRVSANNREISVALSLSPERISKIWAYAVIKRMTVYVGEEKTLPEAVFALYLDDDNLHTHAERVVPSWKPNRKSVASVSGKRVKGVSIGTTGLTTWINGEHVEMSVTVKNMPKVTLSSVSKVSTGMKLSWEKASGIRGYQVWRKAEGETSYTKIASTLSLGYVDATAVAGKTYTYKVRAYYRTETGKYLYGAYSTAKTVTR